MSEPASINQQTGLEIAVIGMNGRFPGAGNIEEFWRNLRDGVESIVRFTDEEQIAAGVPPSVLKLPNYVNAGTVLEQPDHFDAAFFGYSPREAEIMDPQQRLFLECAWQVLEIAGYDADKYGGRIGVYGGVSMNTYLLFYLATNRELVNAVGAFQTSIGNDKDFLPTRVSYKLNLNGPSVNVQTACSTSLVAIHLACQSLLAGECDMALAGGVSLSVPQRSGYFFDEGGIASSDGHCRTFDAKADGTIDGNGVAIVVLKRLSDALADGDAIHAVIKGSAINNDGSDRVGFTAPSLKGQTAVIKDALAMAEVEAETITYVEAHGSATWLGDPIEVAALTRAYRTATDKKEFCAIGSVKTNIGHLDAAAGVTSFIKTVLALKHKELPPSLHFTKPNPQIDFANSPFYVNARLREWQPPEGVPRRAGVSAFGLGGTNAHVILEEAPEVEPSGDSRPWQLLLLSAKTDSALEATTANLVEHFKKDASADQLPALADVAYTLQMGRRAFEHRRMLVCRNAPDALEALETRNPERVLNGRHAAGERPVVFMFSGLGDQYVEMAQGLYRTEPTFREQVDLCAEQLKSETGIDLLEALYPAAPPSGETAQAAEASATNAGRGFDLRRMLRPEKEAEGSAAQKLNQTRIAQPAVFVIEYALARLLMEWGINPQALIGYSIGEYVAACLAGVFTLEEALMLLAARAQMIQELPGGAMLAVPLSPEEIEPLLDERLSLAAHNGPMLCVVAGETEAVVELEHKLDERGLVYRRLQTTHAFHSRMMEPCVAAFVELFKRVNPQTPRIPFVSNVTGTWITDEQATDPAYWARHMCESVRFSEGLQTLWEQPDRILLEVGPGQSLSSLVWSHPDKPVDCEALASLRHSYDAQPDSAFLLGALGRLWLAGAHIDWTGFYRHEQRRRVALPTYPFERKRYWIEQKRAAAKPAAATATQPVADKKQDIADWFYVPMWKQSVAPAQLKPGELATSVSRWLVFADQCGIGAALVERLSGEGQDVFSVKAGAEFAKLDARSYTINPRRVEDYDALLKELDAQDASLSRIVHLWSVTPDGESADLDHYLDHYEETQARGFYSLLYLAQSLASLHATDALDLWVVSNNMQSVSGREALRPEKATALGPCKVIPFEYTNVNCRSLDIELPAPETTHAQLLDALVAEFAAKSPDEIIAYRESRRWVQIFEKVRLEKRDEAGAPALRENGVYLITGGLGGIGLELAAFLAATTRAKLVLTGRTTLPRRVEWPQWLSTHDAEDDTSRKIKKLQALEELGAEVLVAHADVADREQMSAVVAQARERFGAIHGVIHAAGIAGGGIIQVKEREAAEAVLAPKVKGALVLDAVLGEEKLDFFLLCSALSSVLGGPAQVDYCGANAFLDAFAQRKAPHGGTWTVTVNWDIWREVGLAVNTSVPLELREIRQREVAGGMSSPEGVEVFRRILHSRLSQVVVSMQDLGFLKQLSRTFNAEAYLEELEKARQSEPAHPRPHLANPYVAPRNQAEQTIAGVWQQLLGIEQVGAHDNFFQLGGHSLLATQVCSHLREIFQVELPLRSFFEKPTVAGLAEATGRPQPEQAKIEAPALQKRPRGEQDFAHLLAELDQLSPEEVEALLAAESPLTEELN
jgi:acyl transferase domain-containing protein